MPGPGTLLLHSHNNGRSTPSFDPRGLFGIYWSSVMTSLRPANRPRHGVSDTIRTADSIQLSELQIEMYSFRNWWMDSTQAATTQEVPRKWMYDHQGRPSAREERRAERSNVMLGSHNEWDGKGTACAVSRLSPLLRQLAC